VLYEASAEVVVKTSARVFFDVVWDFGRYPEFVSGIQSTEVMKMKTLGDESSRALVRVDAGIFGLTFRYVLDCRREAERRITWKRTTGAFSEAFGSWTLVGEQPDGSILARYENAVDPGFPAPAFAVRWIMERQLPTLLAEMRTRAESRVERTS
jgi:ribosome-associated toxin RatA of RatAB toxin-antitoxin module